MGTMAWVSFTLSNTTTRSCPLAQRHRYGCIDIGGYRIKAEGICHYFCRGWWTTTFLLPLRSGLLDAWAGTIFFGGCSPFGVENYLLDFDFFYLIWSSSLETSWNLDLDLEACHDLKGFGELPFTYVCLGESSQALFSFSPLLSPSRDGKWLHTEWNLCCTR